MKNKRTLFLAALFILLGSLYNYMNGQITPDKLPIIDRIVVEKSKRNLTVMSQNQAVKTYKISLGPNPNGDKQEKSDGRTPEGLYIITSKDPRNRFHLSLQISYPSSQDKAMALARGVSIDDDISIHGLTSKFSWLGRAHLVMDWTNGSIALTNKEIEEIYIATPTGTIIEIKP